MLLRLDIDEQQLESFNGIFFDVYDTLLIVLFLIRLVYVVYLLLMSLLAWGRKECFVQSILWLSLVDVLCRSVFIVNYTEGGEWSDGWKENRLFLYSLYNMVCIMGFIVHLITVIFTLRYVKSTLLLPLILQRIALNMAYQEERQKILMLSDIHSSQQYFSNVLGNLEALVDQL